MIYCIKCGTLNHNATTACSSCGSILIVAENRPCSRYEHRQYNEEQNGYRYQGNGVRLLIAGLFVLIFGIAAHLGSIGLFFQYFWPTVLF